MSPTKKIEKIRRRKVRKTGKKKRAARRNHGTTKSAKELFGDN
jgi:hypothetical protein